MDRALTNEQVIDDSKLDDRQKRQVRALRRQYRAHKVEIGNNGWEVTVTYLDGSSVTCNAKLLKLRAKELGEGGPENGT